MRSNEQLRESHEYANERYKELVRKKAAHLDSSEHQELEETGVPMGCPTCNNLDQEIAMCLHIMGKSKNTILRRILRPFRKDSKS